MEEDDMEKNNKIRNMLNLFIQKLNNKRKIVQFILIVSTIVISFYLLVKCAQEFGHTPYDSVEYYEFNIGSDELESEIEILKEKNPDLNPPADDPVYGNSDDYAAPNYDYYLPIYFYYKDKQVVILTLLSEGDCNHSSMAFYKIIDIKNRSKENVKEINYSFGCSENKKQLNLFEERIVNPLRKQIREKYKDLKQKK